MVGCGFVVWRVVILFWRGVGGSFVRMGISGWLLCVVCVRGRLGGGVLGMF
jgi:hypothetical protein